MTNRLSGEKSLYLRQHGENPVDWFPWGQEAFDKARQESKVLFVSIGYSTCHWCHVMEHETFESPEVAAALSQNFVAIKVDREELPDVDHFYMEALHAFSPRGGWPLNMFVTLDLKPFFGGTYFPKANFLQILERIAQVWRDDPAGLREQADRVVEHVQSGRVMDLEVAATPLSALREKRAGWLRSLSAQMLASADPVWGGVGSAPKFPRSHSWSALMRASVLEVAEASDASAGLKARSLAEQTLKAMAYGGMRDALGGGFHRYSTDECWLVPHFEKMLYDQALLVKTYSEAYALTGDSFYADVVESTLDYLEREMRLPSGGFAAAQDADSEGVEGQFFVWTRDEIRAALPEEAPESVERFCGIHSVSRDGNWAPRSGTGGGGSHGKHVPDGPVSVLALPLSVEWREAQSPEMRRMRERLFDVRAKRVPPVRDDKALVAWNGWMASGLLEASTHLIERPELSARLLASGTRTVEFLASIERDGRWPRVVYGSEAQGEGYLEDVAAVAHAFQMLGVRTGDQAAWATARRVLDSIDARFRDGRQKLSARPTDVVSPLPATALEDGDNATPAAISQAVGAQLRQALVDSDLKRLERALADLAPLERAIETYPTVLPYLLCELDLVEGYCLKSVNPTEALPVMLGEGRFATGFALLKDATSEKPLICDFESCRLVTPTL